MYFWLGAALSLALLLLLNALASFAATLLWRSIAHHAQQWPAREQARFLFALRLAPLVAACVFVALLGLPAYIAHEPHTTDETLGGPLAILAGLSLAGLGLAMWRGLAAWYATRRVTRAWQRQAVRITLPGITLPTYRLRHPFPVVAVVGIWRVRLFVAEQLFDTLTPAEMTATLRHELGHVATYDNLKRVILRACSDVLTIVPAGRSLNRAWAACAESAADEHAAGDSATTSLELASALLKIARIAPPHAYPTTGAAITFMFAPQGDTTILADRVRHLVKLADGKSHKALRRIDLAVWSGLGSFVIILLLAAWQKSALRVIHHFMEHLVGLA